MSAAPAQGRWRWALAALALLLAALIALLPMRLVLAVSGVAERGFTARMVEGSVWDATIHDARWGGVALGTVDAGLSPGALAGGRLAADFVRRPTALAGPLAGELQLAGGGAGVRGVSGTLSVLAALGLVPLDRVELADVDVIFDRAGRCATASGTVRLFAALPGLAAGGLAGPLGCSQGQVASRLVSGSGMEAVRIAVGSDGRYRATIQIGAVNDPLLAGALALAGFTPAPGGDAGAMLLRTSGQF